MWPCSPGVVRSAVLTCLALVSLQNQGLVDQYLSVIFGLEPNQSYAAMLGLAVQFCTAHKETDIIKRYKVNLLYCFWRVISSITSYQGEGG